MGTVYLAYDSRLDRRIALKFLDPDRFPSDDTGVHRRLLHEARAASGLNHPNICHVYDVGGEGRESWIAMEVGCRVADESCRDVTARGASPKFSPQGDRIYFLRPALNGGVQQLWTIAVDGTDERLVADLGAFRPIDVFFDVSRAGLIAWAPLKAGQPELWTATIK